MKRRSLPRAALLAFAFALISAPAFAQVAVLKISPKGLGQPEAGRVTLTLASGTKITVPLTDLDLEKTRESLPAADPELGSATGVPTYDVRQSCATEWPDNFQMRSFCEKNQGESLSALQRRLMLTPDKQTIRKHCLGEWPKNYQMRNFCEEQQLKALGEIDR